MYLDYYLKQLGEIPPFLDKYLKSPSLLRLKGIGYFCGMDYASKEVYPFEEKITRFTHSLTTSLIVWRLTHDEKMTLAGLIHDVATPCFSHVIDYMNQDFEKQESTEAETEKLLYQDAYLKNYLKQDGLFLSEISDFKKYSIVDNERPKVCADRIDGVILTGFGWAKVLSFEEIKATVEDLALFKNEDEELEIGFQTDSIAQKIFETSEIIDVLCHSNEDNYMMQLLAQITKEAIKMNLISYDDLLNSSEEELLNLFKIKGSPLLKELLNEFQTKKKIEIPKTDIPKVKARHIYPLVQGKRWKENSFESK